jgi:hypothetical protein
MSLGCHYFIYRKPALQFALTVIGKHEESLQVGTLTVLMTQV